MSPKPTTNPTAPAPSCSLKGGAGDSFQHTPGPWICKEGVFDEYQTGTTAFVVSRPEGGDMPVSYANCNLIAAAPDLLVAAKNMLAMAREGGIEDWHTAYEALDSAVCKAEGTPYENPFST